MPFFEPDLDDLLRRNIDAGRLRFTTSVAEAGEAADVHFICVGTPQQPGAYAADMSQVFGSISALAPHVSSTDVIVGKSTVPVGTADEIVDQLKNTVASGVDVVWNPEFLREGFAVQDTLKPDRLVVGVASERAERAWARLACTGEAGARGRVVRLGRGELGGRERAILPAVSGRHLPAHPWVHRVQYLRAGQLLPRGGGRGAPLPCRHLLRPHRPHERGAVRPMSCRLHVPRRQR